ncbi:monooxygenase [Mycobacterium sp. EPa45]|nr:monooxygenase [Mycobacterium sp. EPa45]
MKVGLLFDLRNPARWHADSARLHSFTLELCEEAEHLGADSLWFSEHHLFDDGYLPQPLLFAAAAAARTRRIRLGTAVLVAPLHNAVEIAEQAALVDILSAGRLNLGLGAGYRLPEFELYGVSAQNRFDRTDNIYRELHRLWSDEGISPRPVQQPPPVYLGYMGPRGVRRAGLLGAPILTADAALWPAYRAALHEGGHPESTARMSGGVQAWTTDDPERDWHLVGKHLAYQVNSYRRHGVQGTGQPVPPTLKPEDLIGVLDSPGADLVPKEQRLKDFWYGTPTAVAERIHAYVADAPVDTIILWASIGGMPEQMTRDNVTRICTQLAPLLRGDRSTGDTSGAT